MVVWHHDPVGSPAGTARRAPATYGAAALGTAPHRAVRPAVVVGGLRKAGAWHHDPVGVGGEEGERRRARRLSAGGPFVLGGAVERVAQVFCLARVPR